MKNYSGEDVGGGDADVDTAMAHSINVVYAQLVSKVGPRKVLDEADQRRQDEGLQDLLWVLVNSREFLFTR